MRLTDDSSNLARLGLLILCCGFAHGIAFANFQVARNIAIDEDQFLTVAVRLNADPGGAVAAEPVFLSGSSDLSVPTGQVMVFDSSNWSTDQFFTISAGQDADRFNDEAIVQLIDQAGSVPNVNVKVRIIDTHSPNLIEVNKNIVLLPEGDAVELKVHLATDPQGSVSVSTTESAGFISILSGSVLTFDSTNFSVPQTVLILGVSNVTNAIHETAYLSLNAPGYVSREVLVHEIDGDGRIIYVDSDSPGIGNGQSWATAYQNLRTALQLSTLGDQIWVAQGTYSPDNPGGRRSSTFRVRSGVALIGGFQGTEFSLSQREPATFPTILSGDLNGDDTALIPGGMSPTSWSDNCYHVVWIDGGSPKLVDGFMITAGNADTPTDGDLQLTNTFGNGGGVFANLLGEATISNCQITTNFATTLGAGVHTTYGLRLYDNQIRNNHCFDPTALGLGHGGGIGQYNESLLAPIEIVGNLIASNTGNDGAGVYLTQQSMIPTAAVDVSYNHFWFNSAARNGGGFCSDDLDADFDACELLGNTADGTGGAIFVARQTFASDVNLTNGMLLDNASQRIGGFVSQDINVKTFDMIFEDTGSESVAQFVRGGGVSLENTIFDGDAESLDVNLDLVTNLMIAGGEFRFGGPTPSLPTPGVNGPGDLFVQPGGTFTVADGELNTDVSGGGELQVEAGRRCRLNSTATVNLGPGTVCAGTDGSPTWGRVLVEGDLVMEGGTIRQSNIEIRNDSTIANCGNGTGGRLIVKANSTLTCNRIISYDDRHLFIQPSAIASITIAENNVTLIITPDVDAAEGEQGKVLELWAEDLSCGVLDPNLCNSLGLCQLNAGCPDYTSLANARELIVRADARVNLTNRPGFDIAPPGLETIYVENLILEPNAVLNLGLQKLHYETLTLLDPNGVDLMSTDPNINGSSIINIPKLGFPLEVIRFEDQCEFDVRVRRDVTGGSIERMLLGSEGIMVMESLADASVIAGAGSFAPVADAVIQVSFDYLWQNTSSSFCNPPSQDDFRPAIIVYLSDDPIPGVSRTEIARVFAPAATTQPGGINSVEFATFRLAMNSSALGTLDLSGGAWVELEMCGEFSTVYIDNWDPVVDCASITPCDITGDNAVTSADFLTVLSGLGESVVDSLGNVNYGRECLDKERSGFVDGYDLMSWDTVLQLEGDAVPDACGFLDNDSLNPPAGLVGAIPASLAMAMPPLPQVNLAMNTPNRLLVAGKSSASATISQQNADYLYEFTLGTPDIATACPPFSRMKPAMGCSMGAHGPLIAASPDDIYQLHGEQGLIRLNDGVNVVRPGVYSVGMDTVVVGVVVAGGVQTFGMPLADAAFDTSSTVLVPISNQAVPDKVYLGPVIVVPGSGDCPYYAVVEATYNVGAPADPEDDAYLPNKIYGLDPAEDPCINVVFPPGDCWRLGLSPDYQRVRDLAHDGAGNLFVISSSAFVDDYLLVYDTSLFNVGYRISNTGSQPIPAAMGLCQAHSPMQVSLPENPTAMFVDPVADLLFLAKGATVGDGLDTEVHIFELSRDGNGIVSSLQTPSGFSSMVTIQQPQPEYCADLSGNPCAGTCSCSDCGMDSCNYVAGITSIVRDPNGTGETFAVGFSAPILPNGTQLSGTTLFTSATITEFNPRGDTLVTGSLMMCDNLRFPLSAVLSHGTPRVIESPDFNGDCAVDAGDLDVFAACTQGPNNAVAGSCPLLDIDADGDLDMEEILLLQRQASMLP